jgi:hypothetical protein
MYEKPRVTNGGISEKDLSSWIVYRIHILRPDLEPRSTLWEVRMLGTSGWSLSQSILLSFSHLYYLEATVCTPMHSYAGSTCEIFDTCLVTEPEGSTPLISKNQWSRSNMWYSCFVFGRYWLRILISPTTPHSSSGAGIIGQILADVPSGLSLTPPQETKKKNN